MKVLIIDDEVIVRTGLKSIIDWNSLGFEICGEADNGEAGMNKILELNPDLVLLDIKMPGMYGVEVAKRVREKGFDGKIIILSGYSDFEYAHEAIKSGVDAYLLKPIDEDELIDAVKQVREKLRAENANNILLSRSMRNMKTKIINDILCGTVDAMKNHTSDELALCNVDLSFDCFQVAVADSLSESNITENRLRYELLREYSGDESNIDVVCINDKTVILFKGSDAVRQIFTAVKRMEEHAKAGEFKIFMGVGRRVSSVSDISVSYGDARRITERRFFFDEDKIVVFWDDISDDKAPVNSFSDFDMAGYVDAAKNYIEIGDGEKLEKHLSGLKDEMRKWNIEPEMAVTLLVNISTQLKKKIQQSYPHFQPDTSAGGFRSDIEIMDCIYGKKNLYDIINFLRDEFMGISDIICNMSSQSLMKKIENYISKNYSKDLKMEGIAQLFGYNSAYLGKMFKKTFGDNFNTYLDKLRIKRAKQLLLNGNLKVYEVSEQVGFKNIDYFYKKFKHYVRESPKEYRKEKGILS